MDKGDKCPYCGSARIMTIDQLYGEKLVKKCHCHECNKGFNVAYSMTFLYYTNDLGCKI